MINKEKNILCFSLYFIFMQDFTLSTRNLLVMKYV